FERVGEADLAPKLRLETAVGRQLDGTTQEPEPLVDVVPADRELRSATKPVERLLSQRLELLLLADPYEIGVLRKCRLRVVLPREWREVVATVAEPLEPRRKLGVQPCALRLQQARVGDLSSERVLEEVFGLAGHGRARAAANEVAVLEYCPVR